MILMQNSLLSQDMTQTYFCLFCLLIAHHKMKCKQLWMSIGMHKKPKNLSIHKVCESLRAQILNIENVKWRFYPKRFTVLTDIHPFKHQRRSQPHRETASWSGAIRVRRLAQGHHNARRSWDQTSNLAVTSQPALPPERIYIYI